MQLAQVDMWWHIVFCTECSWHRSICGGILCSVQHVVGTGRYVLAQADMWWHIVFCTACSWHRTICGGTFCCVQHGVGTCRYVVAHCFLYSRNMCLLVLLTVCVLLLFAERTAGLTVIKVSRTEPLVLMRCKIEAV